MNVTILYFASLREALGRGREQVELPPQVNTVGDLRHWLVERGGIWAERLGQGAAIRMAMNQQMASHTTVIKADAELAFFPPVTGG